MSSLGRERRWATSWLVILTENNKPVDYKMNVSFSVADITPNHESEYLSAARLEKSA